MNLVFQKEPGPVACRETVFDTDADNAPVGFVIYDLPSNEGNPEAYLRGFKIFEAYRGPGGAAKPVLRHVEEELCRRGVREISMHIRDRNQRMQVFFQRQGYKKSSGENMHTYTCYRKSITGECG